MIRLYKVSKYFRTRDGKRLHVLDNISADIREDAISVFLGKSGCGKTTLLKIIAGLIHPSQGSVNFKDNVISNIGMVFQDFSLFPWLTVKENIEFGLKIKKIPKEQREKIVSYYLEFTELKRYENYFPNSISHGMKQRVAIVRTLAVNPDLVLMDEPFSALDVITKYEMQDFLLKLQKQDRKTIIFVTHDIEEAIYMADDVYVLDMRPARIKYFTKIDLPHRDLNTRFSLEFTKNKKELIEKILK